MKNQSITLRQLAERILGNPEDVDFDLLKLGVGNLHTQKQVQNMTCMENFAKICTRHCQLFKAWFWVLGEGT